MGTNKRTFAAAAVGQTHSLRAKKSVNAQPSADAFDSTKQPPNGPWLFILAPIFYLDFYEKNYNLLNGLNLYRTKVFFIILNFGHNGKWFKPDGFYVGKKVKFKGPNEENYGK